MRIVRFKIPKKGGRIGIIEGDKVIDLSSIIDPLSGLIGIIKEAYKKKKDLDEIIGEKIKRKTGDAYQFNKLDILPSSNLPYLILPYDPPEIWGGGITYLKSREAREEETHSKGIYDLVYSAPRPELFFKSTSSRCVGPNDYICIRSDSKWTVPEPELTFITGKNEIVGFTIGNDVSARDIEGENPLYLCQAKVYKGCSALGPAITTLKSIEDPTNLDILCRIWRQDKIIFEGKSNTSKMKRSLHELYEYLCRDNPIPIGTACMTGTGIVPPDDFTLKDKDLVEIYIENIGTLRNPVKKL